MGWCGGVTDTMCVPIVPSGGHEGTVPLGSPEARHLSRVQVSAVDRNSGQRWAATFHLQ